MTDELETLKTFLQIKSIRTSSNAFIMQLKENDVIVALDGEFVTNSYEELTKELQDIKEKKVLTLLRDGIFFNTEVRGPLGVVCETISSDTMPELENLNIKTYFDADAFYFQYEVFKKSGNIHN